MEKIPHWIKIHRCPFDMEQELIAFDANNKNPLPPNLQKWRKKWVMAIEKEKKRRYM